MAVKTKKKSSKRVASKSPAPIAPRKPAKVKKKPVKLNWGRDDTGLDKNDVKPKPKVTAKKARAKIKKKR